MEFVEVEFDFSEDTKKYLEDQAKSQGISVDDLVNKILKEYLDEITKKDLS